MTAPDQRGGRADEQPDDQPTDRPVTTPSIARELQGMSVEQFDRRVRHARQRQADLGEFEDDAERRSP